jgi:hypothetical protein
MVSLLPSRVALTGWCGIVAMIMSSGLVMRAGRSQSTTAFSSCPGFRRSASSG